MFFHRGSEVVPPILRKVGLRLLPIYEQLEVRQLEQIQHFRIANSWLAHHLVSVLRIPAHQVKNLCRENFAEEIPIGKLFFSTASRPA